jgi:hypothetical protein
MQPVAAELLKDLARVLKSIQLRWYLFDAQAVIVHGFVRQTADVDVTVEVSPDQLPGLLARLDSGGFQLRVRDRVEDFVARTRVLPLLHRRTRLAMDLVLAGLGPEEGFLDRAIEVPVAGTPVPVISAEDLIVVKILAGRAKDLEDVRGILLRKGEDIELAVVRARLRELEQLLDQSDLLPALEGVLSALPAGR